MSGLARFAIEHARFTWLLIVATTVGGILAYSKQPRQEDPEITIRAAQVITHLPGLSPERIEALVTRPIEEQIKTIPEIKRIKSISMTGVSIVVPEAHDRYTDMAPIWSKLRNKMLDLSPRLPSGVNGPNVNDDYGDGDLSKQFYDTIENEQLQIADKTRALIKKRVGHFSQFPFAIQHPDKVNIQMAKRSKKIGILSSKTLKKIKLIITKQAKQKSLNNKNSS